MRAHYLQHVPFEGLGSIESWLKAAGYAITQTRWYEPADLPAPEELDLLVVMGGPMSVNDEAAYPWLVEEKRFIRRVIEAGRSVLGVCPGAQLIASSLGARVYPNRPRYVQTEDVIVAAGNENYQSICQVMQGVLHSCSGAVADTRMQRGRRRWRAG
jgi:GMP synthase-like glutamine amidotransferase